MKIDQTGGFLQHLINSERIASILIINLLLIPLVNEAFICLASKVDKMKNGGFV
jgi:hypothetical protein